MASVDVVARRVAVWLGLADPDRDYHPAAADTDEVALLRPVAEKARVFLSAWLRGEDVTSAVDEARELAEVLDVLDEWRETRP